MVLNYILVGCPCKKFGKLLVKFYFKNPGEGTWPSGIRGNLIAPPYDSREVPSAYIAQEDPWFKQDKITNIYTAGL